MKKIWNYVKHHISLDFHPWHYLTIASLLVVAITFNYSLDFEDTYLDRLEGLSRLLGFFLLYAILYGSAVASYCYWLGRTSILKQNDFWIHSVFGLLLLSIDSSVPFLEPAVEQIFPPQLHLWVYKVSINMVSFITIFLPILLFYLFWEKYDPSAFGLRPKQFDARPYFTMLLIMLPILMIASYHGSFLKQYPMYKVSPANDFFGVPEWVTVMGYEIAYGLDFITVELLFRGFFVLGMMAFLDRGAVLAMAVIYCSLHFGKPMGEALSSIAGGYLLGVIAVETRSIWGGVIVHIGIAWLMELVAFFQKL